MQNFDEAILFETKTNENACWKFDSSFGSQISSSENNEYNQLFQNIWNHPKDEWKMYSDFWRADCPDGNEWIIPNQIKEKEFIGLCYVNSYYKQWIMVEGKEGGSPVVKVCSGDCFEKIMVKDWEKLNANQVKNTWTEIKFQKQNKS